MEGGVRKILIIFLDSQTKKKSIGKSHIYLYIYIYIYIYLSIYLQDCRYFWDSGAECNEPNEVKIAVGSSPGVGILPLKFEGPNFKWGI